MPATEIYLIRHGQTDYNRQFRLQGRSDIPLNRLGLAQARAAHEALRGVHFDAVYASPLRRAVDTACIVSGWPEEKIELDPRLIEIGFGIWEGSDFRTLGPAGTAFFETPQIIRRRRAAKAWIPCCAAPEVFWMPFNNCRRIGTSLSPAMALH